MFDSLSHPVFAVVTFVGRLTTQHQQVHWFDSHGDLNFVTGTFTAWGYFGLGTLKWSESHWQYHSLSHLLASGIESQGLPFFYVGTPFPVVFAGEISPGLSLGFSLLSQVEFRRCSSSVGRTSVSPGVPIVFASAF